MPHPAPNLTAERLRRALIAVLDHALPACAAFDYRLVGTGAALLHGAALPAADVDLLVKERAAVDAFAAALAAFPCLAPPAWLPEARQYYGSWKVEGVEVEISTVEIEAETDAIETFGPGPWVHYTLLRCGPYEIPTVALELRLITELRRQRADRQRPIAALMRERGCDAALLRRGIAPLAAELQAEVLEWVGAVSNRIGS